MTDDSSKFEQEEPEYAVCVLCHEYVSLPHECRYANDDRQMSVSIDEGASFTATVNPHERWNGWLCPRFARSEVERMRDYFDRLAVEYPDSFDTITFDGDDVLVHSSQYEYGMPDVERIEPDRDGLYPVGSYSWCWSADDDDDDSARRAAQQSELGPLGDDEPRGRADIEFADRARDFAREAQESDPARKFALLQVLRELGETDPNLAVLSVDDLERFAAIDRAQQRPHTDAVLKLISLDRDDCYLLVQGLSWYIGALSDDHPSSLYDAIEALQNRLRQHALKIEGAS